MSKLSSVGPFHENATWLPSGDRLGLTSDPGYAVSGTAGEDPSDSRAPRKAVRSTSAAIAKSPNAKAAAGKYQRFFHNATRLSPGEGSAACLNSSWFTVAVNRYPCFGTVSIHSTPSSPSAFRSAEIWNERFVSSTNVSG